MAFLYAVYQDVPSIYLGIKTKNRDNSDKQEFIFFRGSLGNQEYEDLVTQIDFFIPKNLDDSKEPITIFGNTSIGTISIKNEKINDLFEIRISIEHFNLLNGIINGKYNDIYIKQIKEYIDILESLKKSIPTIKTSTMGDKTILYNALKYGIFKDDEDIKDRYSTYKNLYSKIYNGIRHRQGNNNYINDLFKALFEIIINYYIKILEFKQNEFNDYFNEMDTDGLKDNDRINIIKSKIFKLFSLLKNNEFSFLKNLTNNHSKLRKLFYRYRNDSGIFDLYDLKWSRDKGAILRNIKITAQCERSRKIKPVENPLYEPGKYIKIANKKRRTIDTGYVIPLNKEQFILIDNDGKFLLDKIYSSELINAGNYTVDFPRVINKFEKAIINFITNFKELFLNGYENYENYSIINDEYFEDLL